MIVFKTQRTEKELAQMRLEKGIKDYVSMFFCASIIVAVFVMVYMVF